MNLKIGFNWQYDLDLIALLHHPDFDMAAEIKKMILAEVKDDREFVIIAPGPVPFRVDLESCYLNIYFSPYTEKESIDFLLGFRTGQRSAGVKNLFRSYLDIPFIEPYYNTETYRVKSRVSNSHNKKRGSYKKKTEHPETIPKKRARPKPKPIPKEEPKEPSKKKPEPPVTKVAQAEQSSPVRPEAQDTGDDFDLFGMIGDLY